MAKRFPSLVLVVCLALFTGCLEFEQQTLTYRYDAKTDTLRIFQSYQGIFGADAKDGLSQDAASRKLPLSCWESSFRGEQAMPPSARVQSAHRIELRQGYGMISQKHSVQ